MTFYGRKQLGFPTNHNASRQDYEVREPRGNADLSSANADYRETLRQSDTPAARKALQNAPELPPPRNVVLGGPSRQGPLPQSNLPSSSPLGLQVAEVANRWKAEKNLVDVHGTRGTMKAHAEKRRVAQGDLPVFGLNSQALTAAARTANNPNPTPISLAGGGAQLSGKPFKGPMTTRPLDGQVPFVVMNDGSMRVGAPLFAPSFGRLNHMDLSGMADSVRFAGTMQFEEGVLTGWNNSSGGYRNHIANAHSAGLPMELFEDRAAHTRIHAEKPDYIIAGKPIRVKH